MNEKLLYTAISIKVIHEQSGKVEYERERLLGIVMKFMNSLAIPNSLSRSYSTFPLCSWTTLIQIAVYIKLSFIHLKWTFYFYKVIKVRLLSFLISLLSLY